MEYLDRIAQHEVLDRILRKERVVRDRTNPITFYEETEFVSRYRFSKRTVMLLTDTLGERLEKSLVYMDYTIPPLVQILVALRFYGTGSFLKVIGDTFGIHESTVSRIVKSVSEIIASERHAYIGFPSQDEASRIARKFMADGQLPGIVGAIDCTHIPILSPGGDQAELFRNRKGYFSVNVQAICDADIKFTNIVARWPGSTHDSRIFDNSAVAAKFDSGEYSGVLVGDNGYPLRPYLLTPVLQPANRAQQSFNKHLSTIRVKVENLFGVWKRRFPCLRMQLRLKLSTSLVVIIACAVLHNLARMQHDPLPDDAQQPQMAEAVPAEPVQRNEGGQALRNLMIRRFQ